MIRYCLKQWNKNKNKLEQVYKTTTGWNECGYLDIVKAVVTHVLNENDDNYEWGTINIKWDATNITEIDNGDYQGTLLYLIPKDVYQPSECDYLITYVGYGSCSGCDALQAIQDYREPYLTNGQIKDFMKLSKDIVTNMKKPYNYGWRREEEFEEIKA